MAFDLSKAKAALAKANKSGNPVLFQPAAGENRVRIVPLATNPDFPFQELYFHNIQKTLYLSPMSYGEPDPLAEFSDSLIAQYNQENDGERMPKEQFKDAKKFFPYKRTYLPVVIRGKEAEGVKYWAFGLSTYKEILALFANDEYGDISDPKTGVDLIINYTPKAGENFANTTIVAARKSTPLHDDEATAKKFLTVQPDLMGSYDRWTYEQLQSVRDAFVEELNEQSPAISSTTQAASNGMTEQPVEVPAAVATDAEKDFDALFNDTKE